MSVHNFMDLQETFKKKLYVFKQHFKCFATPDKV